MLEVLMVSSQRGVRVPLWTVYRHKRFRPSDYGRKLVPLSQGESMKRELLELRTKLSKQESVLQSTVERLKTANQQKENMEQFIFSHCECPGALGLGADVGSPRGEGPPLRFYINGLEKLGRGSGALL